MQKKSTILRFPYQEECCKSLQEAKEYPHDKYISYVIELQFISEKVDQLSARHEFELETPGSGSELYITNLKSDLEAFYRHLPFNLSESCKSKNNTQAHFHKRDLALTYSCKSSSFYAIPRDMS